MSTEKDQHVNVFVRIKPLSKKTQPEKYAATMIQATSDTEIIVYERSQTKVSKKLTFDKVFDTASTQIDVYNTVVSPLLKEVLAGYNCTVFAYGQTGTGKTYTMEGGRMEDSNLHWQSDTSAGIIPRCLSHLFDELQLLENQQYIVRVNFLELYNEELFDLLNPSSNGTSKIKLYDDASKKGSIIIHGLEEVTVRNKIEIYKILEKGSEKRQTAATLINANSSRSHTVFSITVHTKENTADGEELLKTAKLNLVDLAGSENISKSGAVSKRAKEARNINQSLLTLGRVITALVEKAPHVPYRESKLTRLLQESLGGRTKTSIIATISSDGGNIDETLSTLDYAYRAKHITNRPEINQKIYKRALLKEYTEEVERLRKDLIATREKNGICLSVDQYDSMHELIEWQKVEIKRRINDLRTLEEDMESRKKVYDNMQSRYDAQIDELTKRTSELSDLTLSLQAIQDSLKMVENDRKEQEYLVNTYVASEKVLRGQAEILLNVINETLEDARRLHDKIDNKTKAEKENEQLGLQMRDDVTKSMKNIEDGLTVHSKEIEHFFLSVKNEIENDIATQVKSMETSVSSIVKSVIDKHLILTEGITNDMNISYVYYKKFLNKNIKDTSDILENEKDLLNTIYSKLAPDIHNLLKNDESIVENLRTLNNNVSQKLENVSAYMKNIIETTCKRRFEECNSFRKNLSEIKEFINYMFLNEKHMLKNYKTFAKKIEDLSHELMLLDTCEKEYSENIKSSYQIDEICSNMYRQTSESSNEDIDIYNNLNEFIQNIISQIKSNIDTNINQAQILNRTTIEKGNALVKDLRENLNTGCTTLKQYNNNVKFDARQLQNKMDADRNKVISTNIVASSIIEDIDYTHVTLMKKQQDKLSNLSTVIDNKLTTQHVKLNNWNDEIVRELNMSQKRINEFFTENLYCDVATGTTPPRRQFLYPHQFATQSRERLIQKFRESRSHTEETKHSDLTVKDKSTSAKRLSISNALKNITSAKKNRRLYATSTPLKNIQSNTCDLDTSNKSILSPDLCRVSLPFIHSEAEAHAEEINKENIKFVKSSKENKSQETIR